MNETQLIALATYLCGDSARKSIGVQMKTQESIEWASMRTAFNVRGYETIEECVARLRLLQVAVVAGDQHNTFE